MPHLNENMEEEIVVNEQDQREEQQDEQQQTQNSEEVVEEEKKYSQSDIDKAVKSRLSIEKRRNERELEKKERELEKYKELESTIRSGIKADSLDDLLQKTKGFYEEQGIEVKKYESSASVRDSRRLGSMDAKDLIEISEFNEIRARANELANKKDSNRINIREEAEFMELGKYLSRQEKIQTLREKGIDDSILEEKGFEDFMKKFSKDTPILEIYDLFEKINNADESKKTEKPRSTGSVKSNPNKEEVKDYYSPKDVDKLTAQDLRNPRIYQKVMESRLKWKKEE